VFHVEYRREAMSFSLSEVPTMFAIAFLGPIVAIAVRVVGSIAVIAWNRRPPVYKVVLNASLFAFEMAWAITITHALTERGDVPSGWFLVAAAVGVASSSMLGSVVVSLAIASFEGGALPRLKENLRSVLVVGPIAALLAAVSVAPALFGIEYSVLSIVPIVAVWMVLASHGRLAQRHRDLEALHGFAALAGGSLSLDEVAPAALDEIVALLRADRGLLLVFDDRGGAAMTCSSGQAITPHPTGRHDPNWAAVFRDGGPVWWAADSSGGGVVCTPGPAAGVAAPIRDESTDIGLLVLADRVGVSTTFDDSDLRRTAALVAQLAPALGKAVLHASMAHAALHDALTGDPNRAAFERDVTADLAAAGPTGSAAVLMLDLDAFKDVNDTLGHHVGDRVLIEFATRVRRLLQPGDVLARFGGDEFAIFARRRDVGAIREFATQVLGESHAPLSLDGFDIVVTVSVGVAVVTEDDRDAAAVLRRADIAMYAAKHQHIGVELYREDIDRRTPERLSLLGDLREVLDRGGLDVHFQPKIDLNSSTVVGAEALARWQHPTRGWVSPEEFVRVAEETGLIRRLTDHVLTLSMRAARGWLDDGFDLTVCVNLSTLDLLDDGLPGRIERRLEEHGLAPARLTLEITESSLMADTPRTMATVTRLHDLGVSLSLDDFGTGYSSLSYLRRLPVTELKIDRSFVANVVLDAHDEVIVRSTIELGHNLGLRVVAEGVENDPVLEHLRGLGCDLGQGYGISRPLDGDKFRRWLAATPHHVQRTDQPRRLTVVHAPGQPRAV
jgi:diguanylate cyclase (GGDEF)-like protein